MHVSNVHGIGKDGFKVQIKFADGKGLFLHPLNQLLAEFMNDIQNEAGKPFLD